MPLFGVNQKVVLVTSIEAVHCFAQAFNLDIVTLIFCLRLCCFAVWIRNFNSLLFNTYTSPMWRLRLERKVHLLFLLWKHFLLTSLPRPLNYIARTRDSMIRRWLNYFSEFHIRSFAHFRVKKKMINQKHSPNVRIPNSRELLGLKSLNCCRMTKEKTTDSAL